MKTLRLLLSFAMLLFVISQAIQPALAQSPTKPKVNSPSAANGHNVYLPFLMNGQPSSFDLIDKDIASGKLTPEQGLVDKVYALFSDAQLPAAYASSAPLPEDAEMLMDEVVEQSDTLSPAAKTALAPFFVPPDDPRSWYYRAHSAAAPAFQAAQSGSPQTGSPRSGEVQFASIEAADGKVRIAFEDTPVNTFKANRVADYIDSDIWPDLTTLMNKEPLIDPEKGATVIFLSPGYFENNVVVPFDATTLGITIPRTSRCQQTPVTIYLSGTLPIGDETHPGLVQVATHELMHAIQFTYPLAACKPYDWLMEATAKWSEDYVFPDADSEHDDASAYLDRPSVRLDDTHGLHQYGAYLLFYYLTHTVDPTAQVIRKMWENAAGTTNSYKAMDDAVEQIVPGQHDFYWQGFLVANWNKAPFNTYYKTSDRLTNTVAQAGGAVIPISSPTAEQVTPLYAQIPTGGAYYYHLSFPDDTVRSVTVINGLGYKLKTGPANLDDSLYDTKAGDETYLYDDLSTDALTGANLILLVKLAGKDGQTLLMTVPQINTTHDSYCLDAVGKIEDMVVILSNSDFAHPDRVMQAQGIPTTVYANNVPCYKVTGTSQLIDGDKSGKNGIVTQTDATVTYQNSFISPGDTFPEDNVFPLADLAQVSAQVHWKVYGTDVSGGWYTGEDNFTAGAANCALHIFQGVLFGGPTYRGYLGCGDPDDGTKITYIHHQIESGVQHDDPVTVDAPYFVDMDLAVQFNGKSFPVKPDGSLSASFYHIYDWGGPETWLWNFIAQKN